MSADMQSNSIRSRCVWFLGLVPCALLAAALVQHARPTAAEEPKRDAHAGKFDTVVRPLVKKYCLSCHSTKAKKGSLDLERFATLAHVRRGLKPWQQTIEMLEAGEMPPKERPQPTADERKAMIAWIRGFLDAEAKAAAGDPGEVPLRRLSNAEYDTTIRDLTGVDLRPTREFPADGAGGEGFTNAAESLSDISPTLLTKYLNAAKEIAEHAILLPDGVRFSPAKTRRDWTDDSIARLRAFYTEYTADGKLPFRPYLAATVRHREALTAGQTTLAEVARKEKLNPKYLGVLWQTLTDKTPSYPLDSIRARWRKASAKDVPALAADVAAWQSALWKFVVIGSYRYGATVRQLPNDPAGNNAQQVRLSLKPAGNGEVRLFLASRDGSGKGGDVVWRRPRFERAGKPALLLRDYATFGPAYEVDPAVVFADAAKYLGAAAEAAQDRKLSTDEIAKKHGLDAAFLKRWIDVVALDSLSGADTPERLGRNVPAAPLTRLDEVIPKNAARPAVNGWRRKGTDLPMLMTNSSDKEEHVPGRLSPHKVVVHPTPTEFVAVAWKSPLTGTVRVAAQVTHAHQGCGNSVAWWLEHRRAGKATLLADGALGNGGSASPKKLLKIEKGDELILAVDAKNGDHSCDLTELAFTMTESDGAKKWDLAGDVADAILEGNPHADKHGHKNTWTFVRGPSKATSKILGPIIPLSSALGKWREAAADPARRAEADKLAAQVQRLLTGARPAREKEPDRVLYDNLVSAESSLTQGLDLTRLGKPKPRNPAYGLEASRFDKDGNIVAGANAVTEVRLPAALLRDRDFVVDGTADLTGDRVVQFQVLTAPPAGGVRWDGKSPVVASPTGAAYKALLRGHAEFRRCFPFYVCFPQVVPTDEVVTLKMFHREDEPLERLFLDAGQKARIDRLWAEHRFIGEQPTAENKYLPLFIGFVTQDQPKELLNYFESQRPVFQKRADDFEKDKEAAIPKQLDALLDFAARAYRRPLTEKQKADLLGLYQTLRKRGESHPLAFRGVLARVLVSPAFLFRIEQAPPGKKAGPVDDWELATRLSYFLTSSSPDAELRAAAAAGKLRDPNALAGQARRMLKDDRLRALAIEFGTQWIHVRAFDEFKEKNEKLFPTFDAGLRRAIYEESILFFQDIFQADRPVTSILDADSTFLNEALAKHYGIPGVSGQQFRRVEGVRKYGRGGILGLASVQARQSGSSRTSPVLRGNWVVETLLGEKLPRPPANVPVIPDEAGTTHKLTTRQLVERHVKDASCAVCHVRIDPFGFALEKFDPIGRYRAKDLAGHEVDTMAKLRDGTAFDGIDGLRTYLLTKKKDVIVRLFCKRLLGYALGRSVTLSDTSLLDEMVAELDKNGGRVSAAVLAIVRSEQFRSVRGGEHSSDE